jgi:predicted dienelactone hydrolase
MNKTITKVIATAVLAALNACQSSASRSPNDTALLQSYFSSGSYTNVRETRLGLHCRVFHAVDLAERQHPVVVWGNGTYAAPAHYRNLLEHWASHGFVVVAAMAPNAGRGVEMRDCLNLILDENIKNGSEFQHKIDPDRIGAVGHSQGGGGALMLGRDARIRTTIAIQPYIFGASHNPTAAANQNGPLLLLSGGEDTTASPESNQQPVFDNTNVPVTWLTLRGASHLAPMGTGGSYRGPMTAWLRWHLLNDQQAGRLFTGNSCILCQDDRWHLLSKHPADRMRSSQLDV